MTGRTIQYTVRYKRDMFLLLLLAINTLLYLSLFTWSWYKPTVTVPGTQATTTATSNKRKLTERRHCHPLPQERLKVVTKAHYPSSFKLNLVCFYCRVN